MVLPKALSLIQQKFEKNKGEFRFFYGLYFVKGRLESLTDSGEYFGIM